MAEANKRVVQRRDDGNWEVRTPGAGRASAITNTQTQGIDRAGTTDPGQRRRRRAAGTRARRNHPGTRHRAPRTRPEIIARLRVAPS